MGRSHDARDRSATHEETADETETGSEAEAGSETGDPKARPQAELRWVQLREPRHAVELGRNGRVLASHFHKGYDSWEVLLETYDGEV
jgi:hypothetical protein